MLYSLCALYLCWFVTFIVSHLTYFCQSSIFIMSHLTLRCDLCHKINPSISSVLFLGWSAKCIVPPLHICLVSVRLIHCDTFAFLLCKIVSLCHMPFCLVIYVTLVWFLVSYLNCVSLLHSLCRSFISALLCHSAALCHMPVSLVSCINPPYSLCSYLSYLCHFCPVICVSLILLVCHTCLVVSGCCY